VFSQPVTGFTDASHVDLSGSTNGGTGLTASVASVDSTHYTVTVTGMSGVANTGTVKVALLAGAAQAQSNGADSQASTSTDNSVTWDYVAPAVTINQAAGQADPTTQSPIQFTVVFSKPINASSFTGSDISFAGSTVGGTLQASISGSGANYTVSVTGMSGNGTVVASIPAGGVTDAAGNGNTASTSTDNSVTFGSAPGVTINQGAGQPDPTNGNSIKFDVVFSAPVTGFTDASHVDLTGSTNGGAGLTATVTAIDASDYTVTVTGMPANSTGTVKATITAGAATAITGGQTSLASTSTDNSVIWDTTIPSVTINQAVGQTDPTAATPVQFDVVFSKNINASTFTGSDISFTGSTAGGSLTASISPVGSSQTNFTVSVSGMTSTGTVVASIPQGVVQDLAGNPNAASTSTDNSVLFTDDSLIQFSQGVFNTTNGAGTMTITVTRTGNVSQAATVDYTTVDGTAAAGEDYTTVSGTLSWAAGDGASKTFDVKIIKESQCEGNEGVGLSLTNPTGTGVLGPQASAILVVGEHNPKGSGSQFVDSDGDLVTVKLTGPGTVLYYLTDGTGPIAEIDLTGTDPTKSVLNITVKKPKGGSGDGRVQIANVIESDGSGIKALNLGKADVVASALLSTGVMRTGFNMNGYVGVLTVGGLGTAANPATVMLNASQGPPKPNAATKITAGVIGDGINLTVAGVPLAKLTATSVGTGNISAVSIGSVSIKGKPKSKTAAAIPGNFKANLATTGGGLKSFKAAGIVSNANFSIEGDVGSFTALGFADSELYAGYSGANDGSGNFNLPATIKSFKVTGKNEAFIDSFVIAATIKTANIMSIDPDSAITYGLAGHNIGTVSLTMPIKAKLVGGDSQGSFEVLLV
jgi:hypothetical protein